MNQPRAQLAQTFLNAQRSFEYLKLSQKQLHALPSVLCVSEKLDGNWGAYMTNAGVVQSRNSRALPSCQHIADQLNAVSAYIPADCYLIGELYIPGKDFYYINGHCNKLEVQPEIELHLHDISGPEYDEHTYVSRYLKVSQLIDLLTKCGAELPNIKVVPIKAMHLDDALELAKQYWAEGREGLILRDPQGKYSPGSRISTNIKLKQWRDFDLQFLGVLEGKGKYKGTAGSCIVRDSTGAEFEIGCGTLTDADRAKLWAEREALGQNVCTVRCMKVVNKKGIISMREARFVRFRYDKPLTEVQEVQ